MTQTKVLVACEFSGVVRDAFIAAGHKAVSCDPGDCRHHPIAGKSDHGRLPASLRRWPSNGEHYCDSG